LGDRSIEDVHEGPLETIGGREAERARCAVRAAQLERHRREASREIRSVLLHIYMIIKTIYDRSYYTAYIDVRVFFCWIWETISSARLANSFVLFGSLTVGVGFDFAIGACMFS